MKKLIMLLIIPLILISCQSLKTQASKEDGEIDECFYARYFAREGQQQAATLMADRCSKLLRETGCIKVIKENPDIYRDFNVCWKTRE